MLKENIEERCGRVCPSAGFGKSVCAFAPSGAVGFIDTSSSCDGSRGIAFFGDSVYVNTDGAVRRIEYKDISGLQIISSFEDAFADELCIMGNGFELRISDYSLDKFELKCLLDELCKENLSEKSGAQTDQAKNNAGNSARKTAASALREASEHTGMHALAALSEKPAQFRKAALLEKVSPSETLDNDPIPVEDRSPVIAETLIDIPKQRSPLPKNYSPAPITDENIKWISGTSAPKPLSEKAQTVRFEEPEQPPDEVPEQTSEQAPEQTPDEDKKPTPPAIMSGVIDRAPVLGERKTSDSPTGKAPKDPLKAFERKPEPSESEMRERIGNMSSGEMMSFLSDTLNEINGTDDTEQNETALQNKSDAPQNDPEHVSSEDIRQLDTIGASAPETAELSPKKMLTKWEHLTVEPIWGDIYIKASKSLRELCESGKLTMEQMESELKTHLLSAAEAFEKITADESSIPKVMIPKITELKAAASDFDRFFGYGEDIAIRAMFFMLYQMLTYADRIAESPETKDKLNDFFRRFGSAGITLSMLDMRI